MDIMLFSLPGQNVPLENKVQANEEVDKQKRYSQILEVLGNKELTAKEIAEGMRKAGYIPTNERNFVSPRATELLKTGILEIIGKRKCKWTGKTVSVFRRRGIINENSNI